MEKVKLYLTQKRGEVNNEENNTSNENTVETITVTTSNVVDFCMGMHWFHGEDMPLNVGTNTAGDLSESDGRSYVLYHSCEELELLSREYSNDEGGDSSVATGPQTDIDTEHPDYLIQQGLAHSALHRMPLRQPDWENPLPENTPGLLQKAFPFVFKSGDGDPYQERPRDIKQPRTTWEGHYMEWVAKLPEAQSCTALQFWIHNRASRKASRDNVQIAPLRSGLDKGDYRPRRSY